MASDSSAVKDTTENIILQCMKYTESIAVAIAIIAVSIDSDADGSSSTAHSTTINNSCRVFHTPLAPDVRPSRCGMFNTIEAAWRNITKARYTRRVRVMLSSMLRLRFAVRLCHHAVRLCAKLTSNNHST